MKKILCIDGGGMRGYLPVAILVELEARTGRRCSELFDGIWGTSIGGIAAGLLGSGVPAKDVLKFFTDDGPKIFKKRFGHWIGVFGPRYSARVIEAVLAKRFEGCEPRTRLGLTVFDLATQSPYFFKFGPHLKHLVPLWQAARATSSAQIYFPAFHAFLPDGEHVFWDGGNVANNPAVCALADAKRHWSHHRIVMLSLGCGTPRVDDGQTLAAARKLVNTDAFHNGLATMATLFEADSEEVDYQMRQFLGEHYVRIQPLLDQMLPMDDATPAGLQNLRDAAVNAVRDSRAALERFLAKI
ncbi:MAG: patatin-like phospholipase family protein [Patescibacteria group bacterium]|nr:patatin-like phospholipase family protein [Patescibacteria group bacterium]